MTVAAAPALPPVVPLSGPRLPYPVFYAADSYGCGWYRCVLPAGLIGGRVVQQLQLSADLRHGVLRGMPGLAACQVFQRPADAGIPLLIRALQQQGLRVTVELDDDIWALDHRNPISRQWSAPAKKALSDSLRLADRVTVSTATLAATVSRWQRDVRLIPNALDPARMWTYREQIAQIIDPATLERRPHEKIRLGWAGSYSHMADLQLALPALVELGLRADVELVFMGYDPFQPITGGQQFTGVYQYQGLTYTFLDWSLDLNAHYARIAGLDIAVAPVLDSAFNRAKSCLKWLEHAFWGTAMVCSDVQPYREAVRHGETGFLAKDQRDFRKYLTKLVEDARLRRDIGLAAQQVVATQHLMEHRRQLWQEAVGA